MNREKDFRGKLIKYPHIWVYGSYFKHIKRQLSVIGDCLKEDDIVHLIINSGFADWNMPRPIESYVIDEKTVGEFTNYLDTNCKRIFEGDIVERNNIERYIVGWNDKESCWYIYNKDDKFNFSDISTIADGIKNLTIIGNVYDTPELLNENLKEIVEKLKNNEN